MILRGQGRRRRGGAARMGLERLEDRALLAMLGLEAAAVKPDGRIVELKFSGSATDGVDVPDHINAWGDGLRLTTGAGTALEPLGTVVTEQGGVLTWTVSFLVKDAAQVITFDAGAVTVSAPAHLVSDGVGNWTGGFESVAAENLSLVDQDGFSTENFTRGEGGVTLYVSASHGNNSRTFAQAQNPNTPLKSPQIALDMLEQNDQDGRGAAIRLLRGETFSAPLNLNIGGQDRRHPLVLEDYWFDYGDGKVDPRTRPVIQSDWSAGVTGGLRAMRPSNMNKVGIDHVVIRGLEFRAVKRSSPEDVGYGMRLYSGGHNWMIDDVLVTNYTHNISFHASQSHFEEVTILRSVITDAHLMYKTPPPVGGAVLGSQGLFVSGTTGLMVSQSTFDRNGRTTANFAGRNYYSHNMYLSAAEEAGPATVWGNMVRSGGSHGVQLRPGGILAYNYLGRNVVAGFLDGVGGAITHNVVESAEDFNASEKRGLGLLLGTAHGTSLSSVMERNIVVHENSGAGKGLIVLIDPDWTIKNGLIRNNTLVNAGGMVYQIGTDPSLGIEFSGNLVDARALDAVSVKGGAPLTNWSWLESESNVYAATDLKTAFTWQGGAGDLAKWRSMTGSDANSLIKTPTYVNGTARIQNFAAANGGGTTEATYASRMRERRLDTWVKYADMVLLYEFYAESYQPKNLESLGNGPLDFYGAVDYRPAGLGSAPPMTAPDLLASQDTGAFNDDNVTRITTNLKFSVSNTQTGATVELLRNGVKVATAVGNSLKAITLIDPSVLADGVYSYVVRQLGAVSSATLVTVDRTPPAQPEAPQLVDIVGLTPTFQVSTPEANTEVQLFRRLVGTSTYEKVSSRVGTGAISDTTILAAGSYEYVTRIVDLAGNLSTPSKSLKLLIL